MRNIYLVFIIVTLYSSTLLAKQKPNLLIYCGITMVKPIKEISKIIEDKYNCKIKITQGGSGDLYESLVFSKVGDIYLPGSKSYRTKHLKDGYLLDSKYIGFNQASIFVQKGNPKNIKSIDDLAKKNILVKLCDPKAGSIGKITKKIIIKYKSEDFYFNLIDKSIDIGTDSRNLNSSLIDKEIDATINWRATGFFEINKKYITVIDLPKSISPQKELVLNLLKFSKHKDIARAFMEYAASEDGKRIMKKYGFL
jgi:molybdate transport system substrate-binding protein